MTSTLTLKLTWHDSGVTWHDMTKAWPFDRWKEKTWQNKCTKKEVRQKQASYHSNHPFISRLIQDKTCFQKSNKANMPIMYRSKRRNAAMQTKLAKVAQTRGSSTKRGACKKTPLLDTFVFAVLFVWTAPIENSRGMTCHQWDSVPFLLSNHQSQMAENFHLVISDDFTGCVWK